jgi:hypothetical protein
LSSILLIIFVFYFYLIILFKFKTLVLIITLLYLLFFLIFASLLYKTYLNTLNQLSQKHSINMIIDISNLVSNFPLNSNNIQIIPNEIINQIYSINGFNNYKEFIYPNNHNVELLHKILNYEPETASRYSSFIVQDIINNNYREIVEITEQLLKRLTRYSLPLVGLIIGVGALHSFNVDSPFGLSILS